MKFRVRVIEKCELEYNAVKYLVIGIRYGE